MKEASIGCSYVLCRARISSLVWRASERIVFPCFCFVFGWAFLLSGVDACEVNRRSGQTRLRPRRLWTPLSIGTSSAPAFPGRQRRLALQARQMLRRLLEQECGIRKMLLHRSRVSHSPVRDCCEAPLSSAVARWCARQTFKATKQKKGHFPTGKTRTLARLTNAS